MSRAPSLRSRLTLAVALVLVASLAGFSVVLDSVFRRALVRQFDARLVEDAVAVAGMIEYFPDGHWEIEAAPLPGFETGGRAFFEARTPSGRVLLRSDSLSGRPLPLKAPSRASLPVAGDAVLPDGRPGRLFQATLSARPGDERSKEPVRSVVVTVVRGTEEVAEAVERLRWLLWMSGLTAMAVATLAGTLAAWGGLLPLGRLNSRLDSMDARVLREQLPLEGLPAELRPTVVKLNELLGRLAESFERERRFSADASHELRTPLAAIRSTMEVAASRERSAAEYRAAIQAALAVSRQMSGLVDSLLTLARLDAGQDVPRREPVPLRQVADECLARFKERADERGLPVVNHVPPEATVSLDREWMRTIANNLLSNAVEYTDEGGTILVSSDLARGIVLEVRDSGPPIPAAAIERIFDRFFRLDAARAAAGGHWGIGLALVKTLCDTLDLKAVAENTAEGWVSFRITFSGSADPSPSGKPQAAEPSSASPRAQAEATVRLADKAS